MIDKLVNFIRPTQSTIYDTESLTTLESIGKVIEKVNSCIEEFNNLENKTTNDYNNFLKQIKDYKEYCKKLIENYYNNVNATIEEFKHLIELLNGIDETIKYVQKQYDFIQDLAKQNQDAIDKGTIATQDQINKINTSLEEIRNKTVYSKAVCDGVTNNNTIIQSELNSLNDGDTYVTPKGKLRIDGDYVLMNNFKKNVTLDFSETTFVGNSSPMIIFKLQDSIINGGVWDGERESKTFNDSQFGSMFAYKFDSGCKNLIINNPRFINQPFCCVLLGGVFDNITYNNISADSIGEHIFYHQGNNEDVLSNFTINGAKLNNFGCNTGNAPAKHSTNLLKCAANVKESNIEINNIKYTNSTTSSTGIVESFNINMLEVNNTKGDINYILDSTNFNNVIMNNITSSPFLTNTQTNIGYCEVNNSFIKGQFNHANLVSKYNNCSLQAIKFTDKKDNTTPLKTNEFNNCRFEGEGFINMNYIYSNVIFNNCSFNSSKYSTYSSFMSIGNDYYESNKEIVLNNCLNYISGYIFDISSNSTNTNLVIKNCDINRINCSTKLNRLELININIITDSATTFKNDINTTNLKVNNVLHKKSNQYFDRHSNYIKFTSTSAKVDTGILLRKPKKEECSIIYSKNPGNGKFWLTDETDGLYINTDSIPENYSVGIVMQIR